MANVLSSEARKEAWKFHRAHFVLVGSLVILTGAILALLALLPSVLTLRAQEEALAGASVQGSEEEKERVEILRAQALVAQFSPLATSTSPAFEAILAALRARPSGALVQDIRYTTENGSEIRITGTADRASISAYRDALLADPRFGNIVIPPSAFAGGGGRYTITLSGSF